VRDEFGHVVRSGPCRGLRYPDWALTEVDLFAPKLLGTFEREIHDVMERLIAAGPTRVVNIGAAEGYYAVGLGRRLPGATIHAFEPDERLLSQLRSIAEENGASDRIELHGECTAAELVKVAEPGTLIVCDCEGCEGEVLDPATAPVLAGCDLLVELHDLLVPGVSERVVKRFQRSHVIERLEAKPRWVDDHPELGFMPLVSQQLAISEFRRGPMAWLAMSPLDPRASTVS
jgi:hypothetical protein